ncbi:M48 family metallopeptidase [Bacillus sp. CGMCC 1.16607]|uniref:M48 family metallopeptidase n=1 Tax=Bacillus sp. CGMCC 1.16607 TaxID=3351842 RepID=UPI0036315840
MNNSSLRDQLVFPKENVYFGLLILFGTLTYIFFAISIIGIFIIGGLILISFFLHGLMIAGIRRNGVKLSEKQFPDLYEKASQVAKDMGLINVPDIYVVESEGILNAFATRFFGRNMVVLYSEIFELMKQNAEKEVLFVLAHEFAHLKRRHVIISFILLPAMWVPFIGNAYLRACEYTCDRYGTYYVQSLEASKNALTMLAIGKELYHQVDQEVYMQQIETESGFFAWLNEKLSTHPHLPKRLYALSEFFSEKKGQKLKEPKGKIIIGIIVLILVSVGLFIAGWYGFKALEKSTLWSDLLSEVEGSTPLMTAAGENDTDQITLLLDEGADINAQDSEGSSALHWAVLSGQLEAAKLLLEKGAEPNTIDNYDTTPVMSAVFNEDEAMLTLLLENGADPTYEDSEGKTALDYAKEYQSDSIIEILEKY